MAIIKEVLAGSEAEEAGIKPGMTLRYVNGSEIRDIIDWKHALAHRLLTLGIVDTNGNGIDFKIKHPSGGDIGLVFESPTVDKLKSCTNNCVFCFVKQMPPKQRASLYVRDDDYRLSLVFGSFVTLTNVSEEEWQRILQEKISPIYVSVHTTNPELRRDMMGNPRAANIMTQLKELTAAGITVHAQLVLVPGINDGEELTKSLADLWSLFPGVDSVAVVPVGLTGYREGLADLQPFSAGTARQVLDVVQPMAARAKRSEGVSFVYAADEFFVLAKSDFPATTYYDEFPQLENGVGIGRLFIDDFLSELKGMRKRLQAPRKIVWVTGQSSQHLMAVLQHHINLRVGSRVDLLPVQNELFGGKVTVTGLLGGQDILRALKECAHDTGVVFIPEIALREGLFLDGLSIAELRDELPHLTIISCPGDGRELVRYTLTYGGE